MARPTTDAGVRGAPAGTATSRWTVRCGSVSDARVVGTSSEKSVEPWIASVDGVTDLDRPLHRPGVGVLRVRGDVQEVHHRTSLARRPRGGQRQWPERSDVRHRSATLPRDPGTWERVARREGRRTVIRVRDLSKSYGQVRAVNDISFDVDDGAVFAFLGTNGAGKSTTISCLTTVLAADTGTIDVAGHRVGSDDEAVRRTVGVVFQSSLLDPELSVRENLDVRASFYGIDRDRPSRARRQAGAEDRSRRHPGPPLRHPVGRSEAPRRHRAGARARACRALPGRADGRPGPAQPRAGLGDHPHAAGRGRSDRVPDHALHARDGTGRPGGHHRRR